MFLAPSTCPMRNLKSDKCNGHLWNLDRMCLGELDVTPQIENIKEVLVIRKHMEWLKYPQQVIHHVKNMPNGVGLFLYVAQFCCAPENFPPRDFMGSCYFYSMFWLILLLCVWVTTPAQNLVDESVNTLITWSFLEKANMIDCCKVSCMFWNGALGEALQKMFCKEICCRMHFLRILACLYACSAMSSRGCILLLKLGMLLLMHRHQWANWLSSTAVVVLVIFFLASIFCRSHV